MGDFAMGKGRCLVLGAGEMGQAHLKALTVLLPQRVAAWAPSERRRREVEELGAVFYGGDLERSLEEFSPTHAVVAVPPEELPVISERLVRGGVRHLLVEKPAALDVPAGLHLSECAAKHNAVISVAYNRRFYASVRTARALIEEAREPITSVWFEFTEWSHIVAGLANQSALTKSRWLLANSMHVIDAALHPVGLPGDEDALFIHQGGVEWHPLAAIFAGAGRTEKGALFSCCANWDAPGRWGFEWLTPSSRYIFRPLEKLQVMRRGSVVVEELALLDDLDQKFKPGIFLQDRAFLGEGDARFLPSLDEAIALICLAQRMAGYPAA